MRAFDLTGRVAIITGAARGIGLGASRVLGGAGAHVVMADVLGDQAGAAAGTLAAAGLGAAGYWLGSVRRVSRAAGKKVIVIGIDGMDPRLSEAMMKEGQLPNLAKLRAAGGFSPLAMLDCSPPGTP